MSIAISLHILSVVIWVGGMFFAHFMLRPSTIEVLEPPLRLTLWLAVFKRFFFWVWIASIMVVLSGYWIIFGIFNGMANTGIPIHIMSLNGLVMLLIFNFIYFKPYQKFKCAVEEKDYPIAAQQMNNIRLLVTTNLIIGLLTIVIASAGKYWAI